MKKHQLKTNWTTQSKVSSSPTSKFIGKWSVLVKYCSPLILKVALLTPVACLWNWCGALTSQHILDSTRPSANYDTLNMFAVFVYTYFSLELKYEGNWYDGNVTCHALLFCFYAFSLRVPCLDNIFVRARIKFVPISEWIIFIFYTKRLSFPKNFC